MRFLFAYPLLPLSHRFDCPNILRIFGVITTGPKPMVVLQYCEHGSLETFLRTRKGVLQLALHSQLQISLDVARGGKYLEAKGFVHRDLAVRGPLRDPCAQVGDS